ncbi:MAG: translation initiation factor IF-2 [Acidaminococcaceae bacterium]|nr:translation initiation factor IF-2 [Acidaminococcaceae bacterium]
MAGKRIHEVAKELGRTASEVISLLAKHGVEKKSNFSGISDKEIEIVEKAFAPKSVQTSVSAHKPVFKLVRKADNRAGSKAEEKVQAKPETKVDSNVQPAKITKGESDVEMAKPVVRTEQKPEPKAEEPKVAKPVEVKMPVPKEKGGTVENRSSDNRKQEQKPEGGQRPANRDNGQRNQNNRGQTGGQKTQDNRNQRDNRPQQGNRPQGSNFRNQDNRNQPNRGNGMRNQDNRGQGGRQQDNRNQQGNRSQGGGGFKSQDNRNQRDNRSQQGNRPQGNNFRGTDNRNQPNRSNGFRSQDNKDQGGGFRSQDNRNQSGRPQGNRPQGGGSRSQDNKANDRRKVEHTFVSERERSDRNRERNRANNKNYKDKRMEGSYATKESRPNRSQGHEFNPNAGKKNQNQPVREIIRPTSVEVGVSISVKEFSQLIKRDASEVIKKLFLMGMMVTINQDIDFDTAVLIGDEFGCTVTSAAPERDLTEIPEVDDPEEKRLPRPPVVTVMGHVDHGKTSLLDAIRKTNVTAREAGGITQHIGAYKVTYNGKTIVFLDTPGHEAFTAMRARGAQVTDVAVLVVAADDGVMPQTIEAINHAKSAKVPVIVAINKIDKPTANQDHVKQQLAEHELIPEDWGGDTVMVPVSAHTKEGIPDLLEMIQLVADVGELKANPNLPARGTIIEAQLDKGRGPVATVLVQRGTLNVGDTIIAGTCYGKVRAMVNDRGEKVKKAGPSMPVEVLGLNDRDGARRCCPQCGGGAYFQGASGRTEDRRQGQLG